MSEARQFDFKIKLSGPLIKKNSVKAVFLFLKFRLKCIYNFQKYNFVYSVYILQSLKDLRTYVGYSNDVERRFEEHNSGRVKATKHRQPLKILFIEEFATESEAKIRELWWKSSAGRRKLKEYFNSEK